MSGPECVPKPAGYADAFPYKAGEAARAILSERQMQGVGPILNPEQVTQGPITMGTAGDIHLHRPAALIS